MRNDALMHREGLRGYELNKVVSPFGNCWVVPVYHSIGNQQIDSLSS